MTTELATQEVDAMDALLDALDDEPKAEESEESDEPQAEEESTEEPEQDSPEPETLDLDGRKITLPPGTPPEVVAEVKRLEGELRGDYTRKTQAIAETRRMVDSQQQMLAVQQQFFQQAAPQIAELQTTQARLSQFEQLDWQSVIDSDPVQAQKLQIQYQQERQKAERLTHALNAGQQKLSQEMLEQKARITQEGEQYLRKQLKGWGPDLKKAIGENTLTYGYTAAELDNVTDPRLVQVLHDAMKWKQLQASKPKAMQKVAEAPRVVKPGAVQPRTENKSALERLKKSGRIQDLASLL